MDYENYWLSKINRLYSKQEVTELKFNWWENPNEVLIKIEPDFVYYLLNSIKERFKEFKKFSNINNLSNGVLFDLRNKLTLRVITLKTILNSLTINYYTCSNHIIAIGGSKNLINNNFPINLKNNNIPILIAAFMSDGHNQPEHPHYANIGFLGNKILKCVQDICPNIRYEIRDEKVRFHPILGRILLKLGVPYGCKSKINPPTPKLVYENINWYKPYLQQAFDDEGHAPKKISRKIVHGRSCALLKNLNWKYHEYKTFNNLDKELKDFVMKNPPNLLICEYFMLKKLGIKSSIRCRKIVQYLDRTSADWVIEIYGKDNIRKFHEGIGFSDPEKIRITEEYLKN